MEIKNLNLKKDIINTQLYMFSCQGIHRLYASITKFFQLEDRFNISNYYLRKAKKLNHNAISMNVKTGISLQTQKAQNIVRFINAESAILGYNACFDYILQIIYFALYICPDFYTREEFQKLSKNCNFEKHGPIRNAFSRVYLKNSIATQFYDKLTTFYCNSRKKVQRFSNIIKHQGGLNIMDFPQPASPCVYINEDNKVTFDAHIFDPEYIDINNLVTILEETSISIYNFSNYLFKTLNFPWDVDPIYGKQYKPVIDLNGTEQDK